MKVLILYVSGGLPSSERQSPEIIAQELRRYLELELIANIDVEVITPSEPFSAAQQISARVRDRYTDYDGFVVIHSLEEAAYTANLVALQLTPLGKPIVFTSATAQADTLAMPEELTNQDKSMFFEMDVRTSLVIAVRLATMNVSQVILAYGSKMVRAVRAMEVLNDQRPFMSWKSPDIAVVRYTIELNETVPTRTTTADLQLLRLPHPEINLLPLYKQPVVTLPPDLSHYTAVVLLGYQSPPIDLLHTIAEQLPVYCATFRPRAELVTKNIIVLPAMTVMASLAKVHLGLAQIGDAQIPEGHPDRIQQQLQWLNSNIAGELETV